MPNLDALEVWVFADNRTGHTSQSVGVADALGIAYELKHIEYNSLGTLPNFLKGATLCGVSGDSDELAEPWPDLVIAAGGRLAPVARYIKAESGGKTKLCQMMWPKGNVDDFDILAVPEHDQQQGANIISTVGAPHGVTSQKLVDAVEEYKQDNKVSESKIITLLVGGDTKKGKFTATMARDLAQKINQKAKDLDASLLVSVSRRTSKEAIKSLKNSLEGEHEFFAPEKDIEEENPYFAYLGLADFIVVTGDSVSMCTEATATGKPVFIYAPEELVPAKHQRLHQSLYAAKSAIAFEDWDINNSFVPTTPLNEAEKIAKAVSALF